MKPSRIKYSRFATATRKAANRYFAAAMRDFDGDREMAKMFTKDLKDLRKFATLVGRGSLVRASRVMWNLDTPARDVIPVSAFNYVDRL